MEQVDVLIIGAGLSGIAAACHLRRQRPRSTYTILEARGASGGTWDLFRYPGVRSDSDMFTLSYRSLPWRRTDAMAGGAEILAYLRSAARRYGVDARIRYRHRVLRAEWSSADARWTVHAERTDTGQPIRFSCSFLHICGGYYRYDTGYAPSFPDAEQFTGRIVHPQFWPADLEVRGQQVVVIGSGATAVTLVPALAGTAAHVTLLQRSPSYVLSLPQIDPLARLLRRLPAGVRYRAVRRKNIELTALMYRFCRRHPAAARRILIGRVGRALPPGFDVDRHFSPSYPPWDQRLCIAPAGDLFRAISSGAASVVTDRIERFTPTGIRLRSGAELAADVIITATGLSVLPLGGLSLLVDGEPVHLPDRLVYRGMMLAGVPNLAFTLGYTSSSWTPRAELVADYVCRLLGYLDEHGYQTAEPIRPPDEMPSFPLFALQAGYVRRAGALMPRQGDRDPWRLVQDHPREARLLRRADLGEQMRFGRARADHPVISRGTARPGLKAPRS